MEEKEMIAYRGIEISEHRIKLFLSKIYVEKISDCWIWCGAKTKDGYGNFGLASNKGCRVHRFMKWLCTGQDIKYLEVAHSCDTRECVNPYHLEWKTHYDNIQDCVARGRIYDKNGERNPKAKLDERHVRAMRLMYDTGKFSYSNLIRIFEVKKSTIHNIITNKTWRVD